MEKNNEARKLAARFDDMAAASGLVDVKFYLRNSSEAIAETVCKEVNDLYEAVAAGKCRDLHFADSKR